MPVRPVGERVLIKKTERISKTLTGLFVAEGDNSEQPNQGKVLGKGRKVSEEVNVGDQIVYTRYMGSGMVVDGEELVFIAERDILGILEGW